MRFQNRFDRLFFRGVDERAGVNHQHIRLVGARRDFESALEHASKHDLGVDQILGATEADHADFRRTR